MLRRPAPAFAVLSFLGIAGSSYLYYRHRDNINQTFYLPVRVRDSAGNRTTSMRVMPLLPHNEVERRLNQFAKSDGALRDKIQWKWHTAQVAANEPVEDAFSNVIIERDPSPYDEGEKEKGYRSAGDLLFFTVLDGHGGPFTSRLLSKTLIPTVALEISSLMHQPIPNSSPTATASRLISYLRSLVTTSPNPSSTRTFDQSPTYISLAIQTAFAKLDSELINGPLRLLETLSSKSGETLKPSEDPWALATVFPALSGSCALLALLDTGSRNLYVACTGDSRAVAGYFDEDQGTWTVEVLTEDQTGRNLNELKRMQSEHPADEKDAVIQRGRVLGGLEPSRAFGDARYKLSRQDQERLTRTFFAGTDHTPRPPPTYLKTPPYVTAQPVITHRSLTFLPSADSTKSTTSGTQLRFLILGTDGLWDTLSSEDACALVAGHLAGLRGTVPKQELAQSLNLSVGTRGVEGKEKKEAEDEGVWTFQDANVATHLVRNAFGKGNERKLKELMSIPPPLARSYRDDTTVTVVWWEPGEEGAHKLRAKL